MATDDKWFSVDDVLPGHRQPVLVYSRGIAPSIQSAVYFEVHSKGAGFYCGYKLNAVTHWQPIIRAPGC